MDGASDSGGGGMSIQIGDRIFKTKAEAEIAIRAVLNQWKGKLYIGDPDRSFVFSLLDMHPRAAIIKDCGLAGIRVQPLGANQYRFLAVRTDYSVRDFSWRNCLSPKSNRAQVMSICRSVIVPQIAEFRRCFWDGKAVAICTFSGDVITPQQSEVDHIPPDTFVSLVERWLSSIRMHVDEVEITYRTGYEERSRFTEEWLEPDWSEFHQDNARLRVVSSSANRSAIRRESSHAA